MARASMSSGLMMDSSSSGCHGAACTILWIQFVFQKIKKKKSDHHRHVSLNCCCYCCCWRRCFIVVSSLSVWCTITRCVSYHFSQRSISLFGVNIHTLNTCNQFRQSIYICSTSFDCYYLFDILLFVLIVDDYSVCDVLCPEIHTFPSHCQMHLCTYSIKRPDLTTF